MKKFLSFVMIFTMAISVLSGCGCAKHDAEDMTEIMNEQENVPVVEAEKPAVSENKEVIMDETKAPEVVIIMGAEDGVDNMTYHLEDCKELAGKTVQDVSWEIVKTVGFWQCPVCNPPRYEGYTNAE